MKILKQPFSLIAAGVIVVLAVILAGYLLGPLGKRGSWQVTIATGTPGGTYSAIGAEFARILEGLPDSPITEATAINTAASVENIELLAKDTVDIGFVMKPAISSATADQLAKLSVLARIYMDVVQIVVCKSAGIRSLTDLNAKKVYVGKEGSGTKIVAEKILAELEVTPALKVTEGGYDEASRMLVSGELSAAFFVAGTPTDAVKFALESGKCELLDLGDIRKRITSSIPDLDSLDIPVNSYENQTKRVRTVSADTFLLCREDLEKYKVLFLEKALFDNLERLLLAHAKARDIRLSTAFDKLPEGINLHRGADKFRREEEEKLLILTGALGGKYHFLGKTIKSLLEPYGIHARVIHTDGSVENLQMLEERDSKEKPTLAILQYDVVLASLGDPEHVYGVSLPEDIDIPELRGIRRIARLHEEKVHIMILREKLSPAEGTRPTVEALRNLRVCLGPKKSGTRLLAHAILAHHNINPKSRILLPVSDMVDRIHGGEIDAGFFTSFVPSEAVKTVLNNDEIMLLSIEPKRTAKLLETAVQADEIDANVYLCQLEGEPAINTLKTRAVVVTMGNQPNVYRITKAIFEGEAFLNIEGGVETMKKELPSIHLHPDTRKYLRKVGIIPGPIPINWFRQTWYTLACVMIIAGALRGFWSWKQSRITKKKMRGIRNLRSEKNLDIATKIERFSEIEDQIFRHFSNGRLDRSRFSFLMDFLRDQQKSLLNSQ